MKMEDTNGRLFCFYCSAGILSLHSARYQPYGVSVLLPASRNCKNESASVPHSIPHGLTIKSPGKPALQLVLLQIARCDPEAVVYSTSHVIDHS